MKNEVYLISSSMISESKIGIMSRGVLLEKYLEAYSIRIDEWEKSRP
jgi:hypothetical protein